MDPCCNVESIIDILHAKVGVPRNIPNIETAQWEDLQEVKAELDQYVSLIYPDLPPMAKQIY